MAQYDIVTNLAASKLFSACLQFLLNQPVEEEDTLA
jgi:hypothetical protein